MKPIVRTVSVGVARTFTAPDGSEMTSAVRKTPMPGPVRVTATGLEGDGCAHPPHSAMRVHVFSGANYAPYEALAGRAFPVPAFGENLTVDSLDEEDIRVGDLVRVGTALFRVTQPTVRCNILGRSLGVPQLLGWIEDRLLTGFYLAVIEEGALRAGDAWELVRPGRAEYSIARLNRAMFRERADAALMSALLADADLTDDWKRSLQRRLARPERS